MVFLPRRFLMAGPLRRFISTRVWNGALPRVSLVMVKIFCLGSEHTFLRTTISISYVIGDYIESSSTELGITEINQVVLHGEFSILFFF